jgi:polyhydroxybutyrate depolymerase
LKRLLIVVLLAAELAACGGGGAPAGAEHQIKVGGLQRSYYEHVPASHPGHPALVLILHGGDSDALATEKGSGFDAEADRAGFITVYPDGYKKSWADGRGQDPSDQAGIDDVAFLADVIAEVSARDGVDRARVFMTGISNGGFMSLTFACRRADVVAAVAPDAASMGTDIAAGCFPSRAVSVMDIHGTADPLVPYAGGTMTGRGGSSTIESSPQVLALWTSLDGCGALGQPELQPSRASDGTSLTIARAAGCPTNVAVELWTVIGGGHTWPGGAQYLPVAVIGPVSHQFSAPLEIWRFFAGHGR